MKIHILKKDSTKIGFKYLAGINRSVIPGQVTKLAKSLDLMKGKDITGCIRPVVVSKIKFISGKEEIYIIDGQHLINALMRNGMDIPYTFIEVSDKRDLVEKIAMLNASSKTWALVDYIQAWSAISEEYRSLNTYYQKYDFDLSVLAGILCTGSCNSGGSINKKLKLGEFKINNEDEATKMLNFLTDVLKIVPRMNRYENRYVCTEYINFLKTKGASYNHKLFMYSLVKRTKDLIFSTQEVGKLSEFFEKISR